MNNAFFGGKGSDSYSLRAQKNWLTIPLKDGQRLLFINDIPQWVCAFNKKVKKITIDEGVEQIGEYAFFSCSNLEEIEIFSDRLNINKNTFANCSNLKKIVFVKDYAYYKFKLFLNPKAFGFGKKDIIFQFKDRTIHFNAEVVPDESDGLSITASQEKVIQLMLKGIRNNSIGTSFYISVDNESYSKKIAISYLGDDRILLSDEGSSVNILNNKKHMKWANEVIKMRLRGSIIDAEIIENSICQLGRDIIHAAQAFLDVCNAVMVVRDYCDYLNNLQDAIEKVLPEESIRKRMIEVFSENKNVSVNNTMAILSEKILESLRNNGQLDFYILFNIYDRISVMDEQEFETYKNKILNR